MVHICPNGFKLLNFVPPTLRPQLYLRPSLLPPPTSAAWIICFSIFHESFLLYVRAAFPPPLCFLRPLCHPSSLSELLPRPLTVCFMGYTVCLLNCLLPCIPSCPIILLSVTSYFLVTSSSSLLSSLIYPLLCPPPCLLPYLYPPSVSCILFLLIPSCPLSSSPSCPPPSLPYLLILVSSPPPSAISCPADLCCMRLPACFDRQGPDLVSDPAATQAEGCVSLTFRHSRGHAHAKGHLTFP